MKNKIILIIKKTRVGRRPEAKSQERTEKKKWTTPSAKNNRTTLLRIDGFFYFSFFFLLIFPKICMFVMSKVSICLSLFRFTNYSCNHHYSTALAYTETGIKTSLKRKAGEVPQKNPWSGSNADAEIKVPLLRTQSCESFPFKAGSRSEYSYTSFTCCLESLTCQMLPDYDTCM